MRTIIILCLSVACAGASAQDTVGELLDQGGAVVPQSEVQRLYAGTTRTMGGTGGFGGALKFDADGSFTGHIISEHSGLALPTFGTWAVDPDGRICLVYKDVRARGQQWCRYWYMLRERYYISALNEPSAPIRLLPARPVKSP